MSAELTRLRAEVRRQRSWIARLAHALYVHTRTDLAPDATLPALRKLALETRMKSSLRLR